MTILQALLTVRYSIKKGERIEEMLDNVVSGPMAIVSEHYYGRDKSKIPAIDYLGMKPVPVPLLPGAHVLWTGSDHLFIAFLFLMLARRLSSTCSVTSPTNSPFMVLHAPLDNKGTRSLMMMQQRLARTPTLKQIIRMLTGAFFSPS